MFQQAKLCAPHTRWCAWFTTARATLMYSSLLVENLVSFLECCNLCLSSGDAFFIADMNLKAHWFQVLLILKCFVQFRLGGAKILAHLTRLELRLILCQAGLELEVVLGLLGCRGVTHESRILCCGCCLTCFCVCEETCKVANDHFKHANDAALG